MRKLIVFAMFAMLACDPAVTRRTIHVTPAAPGRTATAAGTTLIEPAAAITADSAVIAVEKLALEFGFTRDTASYNGCPRQWRFQYPASGRSIHLCLRKSPTLEVLVAEGLTSQFGPKADSLVRALSYTLRKFGTVRVTPKD